MNKVWEAGMREFFAVVAIVALAGACSSGDDDPGEARASTTVTATVTTTPEPVSKSDACTTWARAVNVDSGLDAELAAADDVAAAAAAFGAGSAEYRAFIMQAGAMYRLALEDHGEGGGVRGLKLWLRARANVRDAAALVDRICP